MRRQKRIELYEKHVKRQNVRELKKRDAEKKMTRKNKKFACKRTCKQAEDYRIAKE